MLIQWFPGHMARTKRLIIEHLKAVDVAAELLDARIPRSSANPMVAELLAGKPRLVILNKADLADPEATEAWLSYFKAKGIPAMSMTCGNGRDKKLFLRHVKELAAPVMEKWKRRGLKTRSLRLMILGIPNVGKSTLLNFISGVRSARTANTPGHTRGKQWVRLAEGLDLLDTPGILWPKFEDQTAALRLAATGAIAGDVFNSDEVTMVLMETLAKVAPRALYEAYGIEDANQDPQILLDIAAKRRGCLLLGGAVDYDRVEMAVLGDFRNGRLGRITLDERPEECQ